MFVSEAIGDEYTNWKLGDIVIIDSQTGSGKTFFVLNKLLPYMVKHNQNILYLTNRTALRDQISTLSKGDYSDYIFQMNYQFFEKISLSKSPLSEQAEQIQKCSVWVLDEAHYFLSDATFNENVMSSLSKIISYRNSKLLIFMTATPEYLFLSLYSLTYSPSNIYAPELQFLNFLTYPQYPCNTYFSHIPSLQRLSRVDTLLKYKELSDEDYWRAYKLGAEEERQQEYLGNIKSYFNDYYEKLYLNGFFPRAKKNCKYYSTDKNYSYICPIYFKSLQQLCTKIVSTNEKWLIFVSSKQLGEEIKSSLIRLMAQTGSLNNETDDEGVVIDPVVLITANSKKKHSFGLQSRYDDYAAYRNIVENETCLNRITIATAVLDNGINIKDDAVHHVAILEMNQTSFLQMLGRKRIRTGEHIFLYLWAKDLGEVKAYFNKSVLQYIKFLAELKIASSYEEPQASYNFHEWANCAQFVEDYMMNGNIKYPFNHYVRVKRIKTLTELDKLWHFRLYEANPVALARLTYDYYRMAALLERFKNYNMEEQKREKEVHWLKYQLFWLGLDYDGTKWIDYPEHCESQRQLEKDLEEYVGRLMPPEKLVLFKQNFLRFALTNHPPLLKQSSKVSISTANRLLSDLGYPVKIESVQYKRKTCWRFQYKHL